MAMASILAAALAVLPLPSLAPTPVPAVPPVLASRGRYDASAIRATPDAQLTEMLGLYDSICFTAFPGDEAVAKTMLDRGAEAMTPDMVRTYLHDDPGVGWFLRGATGQFVVTIEVPPYHACAVRTLTRAGFPDMTSYQAFVERKMVGGHGRQRVTAPPFDSEGIHATIMGEGMLRDDQRPETLMVGTGQVSTAEDRRKYGDGIELRFVRQILEPAAKSDGT